MQITLTVMEGPHAGKAFRFNEHANFIVGRAPHAHFRFDEADNTVSRHHFLVEVNPPLCRLLDMNSRNGTFVNGQRVEVADLKHGDEIKAGRTVLRVAFDAGAAPTPIAQPALPPVAPPQPPVIVQQPVVPPAPKPEPWPPAPPPQPALGPTPDPWAPRPSPQPMPPAPTSSVCPICEAPSEGRGQPLCQACQASSREQSQPVAGYKVVRELGRGGMGIVYAAVREADGTAVALKTIKPELEGTPLQRDRFLREASIIKSLNHPHIVAFRDMGEAAGELFYFAMEFVRGTDAAQLLKKKGELGVDVVLGLMDQAMRAATYAHSHSIVHRDIKPANLLIGMSGRKGVVKLADFGLARAYQGSQLGGLTTSAQVLGTLGFMPPEQVLDSRDATPQTDQYALASTLYFLLTGKYVLDFPSNNYCEGLRMVLEEKRVPILKRRKDLPKGIGPVIGRALELKPRDRYPDVESLRQALRPFRGKDSA
jgi:serine/threonine-protein kinase